jgi:predicted nucleotidyltransferase
MHQLTVEQRDLIDGLVRELSAVDGVAAVVLGGSYARGCAHAGSDIDLGLLYSERAPFAIEAIRALAAQVHDVAGGPVVTGFYEWGPWVNGGAWLTVRGQRVDLLYRSLEHLERVIDDAEAGRYEVHHFQQPPFGFFSATYLGELAVCVPLFDRAGALERLRGRVVCYPDALRSAVLQNSLWHAEFTLAVARKCAARGDVYGTAGCATRVAFHLVLALFALNRAYLVNDKTALAECAAFARVPRQFGARLQRVLSRPGAALAELAETVAALDELFRETAVLTEPPYAPRYALPR